MPKLHLGGGDKESSAWKKLQKMASRPNLLSKEPPPDFFIHLLMKDTSSFLQEFDNNESRVREIVGELKATSIEVKDIWDKRTKQCNTGAIVSGIGFLAAPFTAGLSLLALTAGGATLAYAKIQKDSEESGGAKKVETLGKELLEIVEPLRKKAEEIKTTCETLEEKSGSDESALGETDEFQKILRRVPEVKKMSVGVIDVVVALMQKFSKMLKPLPRPDRDDIKFKTKIEFEKENTTTLDNILQVAELSQKVVDEFDKMKKELGEFP
ncbi:hypothetical protein AALO_G00174960 [Alosa alosa]|uniref:Apolipoprotein L3-like n=1 Tax=Alosa alosa TaxID=278164 RepID=A0AAV6G7B8_9TELE|nr:hypothetical protein AALO_G00174960 [Alosa alosa]